MVSEKGRMGSHDVCSEWKEGAKDGKKEVMILVLERKKRGRDGTRHVLQRKESGRER